MLEVWVTGVPAPRVSAHGGGAGVLCCRCPSTRPRSGRDIQHTGRCQGGIRHALVDTGCTQTLAHQSLVRPGALLEAEWVEVKCVHSDIHRYPVVSLVLKFKGKKHRVKAVVSPRLWHPLILGTNWPGFHGLLGEYAGMRSQPVDV